jgi:membrane protein YqaA with SNARE-associated domain
MTSEPAPPDAPLPLTEGGAPPGLRRLFLQLIVGIVIFMGIVAVLALAFEDVLLATGQGFVERLGGPGVGLAFFILDAVWLPIPHETFSGLALVGGMPFVEVWVWGSVGSLAGGMVGYTVCRRIGRQDWFQRWLARKGGDAHAAVRRWGVMGVALGAVSPLPYSISAWAAGALGMELRPFVLVSLLRIPRVGFYLWLIQIGVLGVMER